jgi:hypothetical protein
VNQIAFATALICSQRNPDNKTETGRFHSRFLYGDLEGLFVSKKSINDPEHWRDRAAAMRALANTIKDTETVAIINRLADDYDKLADRAKLRSKAGKVGSPEGV